MQTERVQEAFAFLQPSRGVVHRTNVRSFLGAILNITSYSESESSLAKDARADESVQSQQMGDSESQLKVMPPEAFKKVRDHFAYFVFNRQINTTQIKKQQNLQRTNEAEGLSFSPRVLKKSQRLLD
jgi:hypothetical protein